MAIDTYAFAIHPQEAEIANWETRSSFRFIIGPLLDLRIWADDMIVEYYAKILQFPRPGFYDRTIHPGVCNFAPPPNATSSFSFL